MANVYERALWKILGSAKSNALGVIGEVLAQQLFEQSGYIVTAPLGKRQGDLAVVDRRTGRIYRVEVKTARRGADGKWRFTVWKKNKTDCRYSDFVVLLAVWSMGHITPFVIPVREVGSRSSLCISSLPATYSGQWAPYRRVMGQQIRL